MTCAQGLLRLLWGGGARSWSATGLPPSRGRGGVITTTTTEEPTVVLKLIFRFQIMACVDRNDLYECSLARRPKGYFAALQTFLFPRIRWVE